MPFNPLSAPVGSCRAEEVGHEEGKTDTCVIQCGSRLNYRIESEKKGCVCGGEGRVEEAMG